MDHFAKTAIEVLATAFPNSDLGKLLALAILAIFFLILFGRIRLEWIGLGIRQIFRWLRCKVRNKHHYQVTGMISSYVPSYSRGVCRICGKTCSNLSGG